LDAILRAEFDGTSGSSRGADRCLSFDLPNAISYLCSTLCLKKNDNDVLRDNFNGHQPILIIFVRDVAE